MAQLPKHRVELTGKGVTQPRGLDWGSPSASRPSRRAGEPPFAWTLPPVR